ncbi:hypothetical protein GSU68_03355 [Rathayibacter sp. VKM Ac-2759]|uniref:hypothetical protein n=1 Tax=Rathayibacter sp. VKM Ac-2759 TaxID=2609252 RepID=UPI0013173ADE|nr:hypothetical protein [Rathayibacter sp. VKM Ac-2759]QHC65714.1 hypothetical protein GSU68_03355 [Rathayibacter sp. VKM Ac-2759]
MEIIVALVGLLGGLLVAIAAVVVVVVGRRRAKPASLVDVEVRLSHAGDDWWRVSATVRNLGRTDLEPSTFVDGRPITITLGGAHAGEWYGTEPRAAEWSLASGDTMMLAPCVLPRTVGVGATVVVRGRPDVRIDAPLRYIPVRENIVETQGALPGPTAAAPARPAAPHRVVDAPLEAQPEQESVVRGGFGMYAAMGAGVLGALFVGVALVVSLAGSSVSGIGEAGIVLIGTALVGLVGTLTLRLFRRAFEPPALWRTPRQRLMRPGTIIVLVLAYTGLALFCLEFLIQGASGETTWVAGLGVVLLFAALVGAALVGFLRLVVLIGVRRASRA